MRNYFWLIFLALGIWQVIGSIAERATKKNQEQRVKDLAAQRRRQQMIAQRTSGGRAAPAAVPTGARTADRASELAARRKAQLDELRTRRATRTGKSARPTPSSPVLRPSQPPSGPPAAPPVTARRPAPAPAPVRRKPTPQVMERLAMTPAVRRLLPLERSASTEHRLVPTKAIAELSKSPRILALPGVDPVAVDRALLRRMMLYREILEPPVALREQQSWER